MVPTSNWTPLLQPASAAAEHPVTRYCCLEAAQQAHPPQRPGLCRHGSEPTKATRAAPCGGWAGSTARLQRWGLMNTLNNRCHMSAHKTVHRLCIILQPRSCVPCLPCWQPRQPATNSHTTRGRGTRYSLRFPLAHPAAHIPPLTAPLPCRTPPPHPPAPRPPPACPP